MIFQINEKQLITINAKVSEKRNFFFESDLKTNFTMCVHIFDVTIKKILIKNKINNFVKIL